MSVTYDEMFALIRNLDQLYDDWWQHFTFFFITFDLLRGLHKQNKPKQLNSQRNKFKRFFFQLNFALAFCVTPSRASELIIWQFWVANGPRLKFFTILFSPSLFSYLHVTVCTAMSRNLQSQFFCVCWDHLVTSTKWRLIMHPMYPLFKSVFSFV